MAVRWEWKAKVGEINFKSLNHKEQGGRWTLEMFSGGNCMCAFIRRYKEKGKKMYQFFTFFDDLKHAKSCLEDFRLENMALGDHKVINVKLKVTGPNAYSNREMLQLGKILASMKYKVILY